MKQILLFLFFFSCIYIAAAEVIEVSPECFEILKNIDHDHKYLERYFKYIFNGLALEKRNDTRFSTLLRDFFLTNRSVANRDVPKFHAPATTYLKIISDKYGPRFDTSFNKALQQSDPGSEDTAWHAVETLFNAKLKKVITVYKIKLAKDDTILTEMRKKGIIVCNNSSNIGYINPALVQKKT